MHRPGWTDHKVPGMQTGELTVGIPSRVIVQTARSQAYSESSLPPMAAVFKPYWQASAYAHLRLSRVRPFRPELLPNNRSWHSRGSQRNTYTHHLHHVPLQGLPPSLIVRPSAELQHLNTTGKNDPEHGAT